jgi:hypothetical protein
MNASERERAECAADACSIGGGTAAASNVLVISE